MHLLLARGCFGAAAMQMYYLSIFLLPLADAVTLFFLNPTLTAVGAWMLLREKLGILVGQERNVWMASYCVNQRTLWREL